MNVSLTPELEEFVSARFNPAATTRRARLSAKRYACWKNTIRPVPLN